MTRAWQTLLSSHSLECIAVKHQHSIIRRESVRQIHLVPKKCHSNFKWLARCRNCALLRQTDSDLRTVNLHSCTFN